MKKINKIPVLLMIFFVSTAGLARDNQKKVDDFTLTDYNGKTYTLSADKDSKAIVIMFISTRCPVSNSYNDRMSALYKDYLPKGVSFIAINSNSQEDIQEGHPVLSPAGNHYPCDHLSRSGES